MKSTLTLLVAQSQFRSAESCFQQQEFLGKDAKVQRRQEQIGLDFAFLPLCVFA